jgi:hypothetical protein
MKCRFRNNCSNPEGKAEGGQEEAYFLSVAILFTVFLSVFRAKSSLDYKNNTLLLPLHHNSSISYSVPFLQPGYRDTKIVLLKGILKKIIFPFSCQ